MGHIWSHMVLEARNGWGGGACKSRRREHWCGVAMAYGKIDKPRGISIVKDRDTCRNRGCQATLADGFYVIVLWGGGSSKQAASQQPASSQQQAGRPRVGPNSVCEVQRSGRPLGGSVPLRKTMGMCWGPQTLFQHLSVVT